MEAMGHELLAAMAVAGRICAGLAFLLAAAQKLSHWRILSGVVANYRILPRWAVTPATALLPPLELLIAMLLLGGLAMPWTALVSIALLAVFALAMAVNLRRGRGAIDCGCGQSFLAQTLSWTLVARNAALAALLLPSLFLTVPAGLPAVLSGAGAGVAFFLLYLLLNAVSALPRPEAHSHRFA